MPQILPRDLPPVPGGILNPNSAIVADDGSGVFRPTPAQIADAGAPISSQAEAEAGAVNTGRMSPLRVKQAIDALGVSQDVLAAPTGGEMVGFEQIGTGSVASDVKTKLQEIVSLTDKGALPNGSPATTGVNNALATARYVETGTGNYQVQGITLSQAGQVLTSRGNTNFMRSANGAILNTSASDITINGLSFYGESPTYTGDLLTFTGQRGKLLFSAARNVGASKAVKITGSSWLMLGVNDVYQGDVQFTTDGVGGVSQYHNVIATRITGALSLVDTSMVSVSHSLILGNVLVDKGIGTAGGHGARFLANRIVGNVTVTQSNTSIGSGMSVSGNMTIGDGTNLYDGITVDPSYVQASGFSFTILAGAKGTYHLGHIVTAGIVPTIPASVRQTSNIYHGELDYTPTISGGGGSFALGNGTLTGKFSQQGNQIFARTILAIGSTTTLPTSGLFTTVPVNTGGRPILCQIDIFKSGVGNYTATGKIFSDGLRILGWMPQPAAIDTLFTNLAPATLGNGDVVTWTFSYALGGV